MIEIGENLKDSGKKFISKIALHTDIIQIPDESQNAEEIEVQNNGPGFGEVTSETQKKLEDSIVYDKEEKNDKSN